jgi:hypothetical protein
MKTLKIALIGILLPLIYACSHPLEIVGNGDITTVHPGTGTRGCSLEESTATPVPDNCAINYVLGFVLGAGNPPYWETYTATPRADWKFDHWENCAFDGISVESGNTCRFTVAAATVHQAWGLTMPSLVAVFTELATDGLVGFNVIYDNSGSLPADIVGSYDRAEDCTLAEGGGTGAGAPFNICYRKDDGSSWRIWNTGCGWNIGRMELVDPFPDPEYRRYALTYAGLCSEIPPEEVSEQTLINSEWLTTIGEPLPGINTLPVYE